MADEQIELSDVELSGLFCNLDGQIGGTYQLPDGREFWMDAAAVRAIMERIKPTVISWLEAHLAALLASRTPDAGEVPPIPMILFCPKCGLQHIDAPDERTPDWDNPPHKSHLCHGCGTIWRPADVPTEGVIAIQTRGSKDTIFYNRAAPADAGEVLREALTEAAGYIFIAKDALTCSGPSEQPDTKEALKTLSIGLKRINAHLANSSLPPLRASQEKQG